MELHAAQTMAIDLMREHGLRDQGWTFRFDHAKRRFGRCSEGPRSIQLSAPLVTLNGDAVVRDVILHEIAHALAGCYAGHGWQWAQMARRIGLANPTRCCNLADTNKPELRWKATCPSCSKVSQRARRPRHAFACGDCCRKKNFGRFSADYLLNFESQGVR